MNSISGTDISRGQAVRIFSEEAASAPPQFQQETLLYHKFGESMFRRRAGQSKQVVLRK